MLFIALSTLLLIPGVVAEIMSIASGRYAEPAMSVETGGLRINSLYRATFLKWNQVDTVYVDPPQTGGYLQSKEPVTLYIFAEDGRSWRFGRAELAAEPWQMAEFADVVLARAFQHNSGDTILNSAAG